MIDLQIEHFFVHRCPQPHFGNVNKSDMNEALVISDGLIYNMFNWQRCNETELLKTPSTNTWDPTDGVFWIRDIYACVA